MQIFVPYKVHDLIMCCGLEISKKKGVASLLGSYFTIYFFTSHALLYLYVASSLCLCLLVKASLSLHIQILLFLSLFCKWKLKVLVMKDSLEEKKKVSPLE